MVAMTDAILTNLTTNRRSIMHAPAIQSMARKIPSQRRPSGSFIPDSNHIDQNL